MRHSSTLPRVLCIATLSSLGVVGCDGGTSPSADAGPSSTDARSGSGGSLSVLLEAEDTITEGLEAGSTGETIQDGWAVTFESYVTVIGDIDVHLATDQSIEAEAAQTFAVDLVDVPAAGLALWALGDLRPGRWEFNYRIAGAGDGATRHQSVPEALFSEMVREDWSCLIAGTMTQAGGESCPPASLATPGSATPTGNVGPGGDACYANPTIQFRIGASAETAYGPCEIDEVPGFAVTDGNTAAVATSIHGDHIFFSV